MKNLVTKALGIAEIGLIAGIGMWFMGIGYSGLNQFKSNIYAHHKLVHDYDSIKTKYDSLNVITNSTIYGKNLAIKILKELIIKNDSLEKEINKFKVKQYSLITKKERDEEFEEIEKGVIQEFKY